MSDPILHHYDLSPYAEKVRLIFGLKGLAWHSVQIPMVMPKPDLTELTGGYRRTPTLQLGADIYCDTKICAQVLEDLHPEPSLFPGGDEATVWGVSRWAETTFMMAVTAFFGLGGLFDEEFIEDRMKMFPDADFSGAAAVLPAKLMQARANLDRLERQLGDGRRYLLGGDRPSLADLSAYHAHNFLRIHPRTADLLEPLRAVPAWLERIVAIGHGERSEMESKDAIAVAKDADPAPFTGEAAPPPEGLAVGDPVVVLPEEAGSGPVSGELLESGVHEIRIRRQAERAGELVVHFPREDYLVVRAG
ncbi:MAG: glutathione S-transferase family protein [Myxococcota bacterium]|nr:glutathione S-transferase family protein [Myxococcota bacterium]